MNKNRIITGVVILLVLILGLTIVKLKGSNERNVEIDVVAECIGQASELYVQLGCVHCETQKEMFGKSYSKLNIVDCYYHRDLCF